MEKERNTDPNGGVTYAYNERRWYDACVDYLYNPLVRRYLKIHYRNGLSPDEAIEQIRAAGFVTYVERHADKGEPRRALGRPKMLLSADDVTKRLRAALLKELAALESRELDESAKALVEATKKQVLGA